MLQEEKSHRRLKWIGLNAAGAAAAGAAATASG